MLRFLLNVRGIYHLAITFQPLSLSSCLTAQPHHLPPCPYFQRKLCVCVFVLFVSASLCLSTHWGCHFLHPILVRLLDSGSQGLGSNGQWHIFLSLCFNGSRDPAYRTCLLPGQLRRLRRWRAGLGVTCSSALGMSFINMRARSGDGRKEQSQGLGN